MKSRHIATMIAVLAAAAGLFAFHRYLEGHTAEREPAGIEAPERAERAVPTLDDTALTPGPEAEPAPDTVAGRPTPGTLGLSLQNEVDAAIERGLDWLAAHQREDGSWSNPRFPALTALSAKAFIHSAHPERDRVVDRALDYILSCVQDDGGIYQEVEGRRGGGLSNYNTAISMMALHAADRPDLTPYVLNARTFIARMQHFGDDSYSGGFGYDRDTDRAYADLLNTYWSVVAMRETAAAEEARPPQEGRVDIDWAEAVAFIEKMQNPAAAGTDQEGGFFYRPGESKAGATTNEAGVVYFRSYGSMTYAGMLSLIYADVDRQDARVRSAFDWAARHWTLAENPGMGDEGLFYFYNVLTKCLDALDVDAVPRVGNDGVINWRKEMAGRLVSRQHIDPATGHGYWKNDDGRFWESDPVLTTAYSLLALHML